MQDAKGNEIRARIKMLNLHTSMQSPMQSGEMDFSKTKSGVEAKSRG